MGGGKVDPVNLGATVKTIGSEEGGGEEEGDIRRQM